MPDAGIIASGIAKQRSRIIKLIEVSGSLRIGHVMVDGQQMRVAIRPGAGRGTPLLVCNGLGANLELLEPLAGTLGGIESILFDVPGIGGSSMPARPYRFKGLARLVERMLQELGYAGHFDVLGVSWGGALAQQIARTFP